MGYKKNFRNKRPKDNAKGLSVTVYNNNVEGALKVLKRKVKDSNLFIAVSYTHLTLPTNREV